MDRKEGFVKAQTCTYTQDVGHEHSCRQDKGTHTHEHEHTQSMEQIEGVYMYMHLCV